MNSEQAEKCSSPLLIVDDDEAIREVIQEVVQAEGYPVITASDGLDAFNRLRSGIRPGVILLDLRMPSLNGIAFHELKMADPMLAAIPVVILSGDRDANRVAANLGTECIEKPIDFYRLLAIVERYCGSSVS